MSIDTTKYKHRFKIQVRNYEIDWQGIVHNANYLLYFEVARVDYFKSVGMEIDERAITGKTKIVVVRNELDYMSPATFDDELTIHTRISSIKYSSMLCESVMLNEKKNILIAKNVCILVWLNPTTNQSVPVPNYFRDRVKEFEGNNAIIEYPITET